MENVEKLRPGYVSGSKSYSMPPGLKRMPIPMLMPMPMPKRSSRQAMHSTASPAGAWAMGRKAAGEARARRHIVVIKIWQFSTFLTSLHNKTCTRTLKRSKESQYPIRDPCTYHVGVRSARPGQCSKCQRPRPVNRLCKYLPNLLKFISDRAFTTDISLPMHQMYIYAYVCMYVNMYLHIYVWACTCVCTYISYICYAKHFKVAVKVHSRRKRAPPAQFIIAWASSFSACFGRNEQKKEISWKS